MDQFVSLVELARAHYHMGAFDGARRAAMHVLAGQLCCLTAQTLSIPTLWQLGREVEEREVADKIVKGHGKFSFSRWAKEWPYRRPEDLVFLIDPLICAGLPDQPHELRILSVCIARQTAHATEHSWQVLSRPLLADSSHFF